MLATKSSIQIAQRGARKVPYSDADVVCAALSWRIVSKRLSSSPAVSLVEVLLPIAAKFKRIGCESVSSGKESALRSACACAIFSGNRHRANSSAQWLKPAVLNCRVFRAITKPTPSETSLRLRQLERYRAFPGSMRKQELLFYFYFKPKSF